MVSDIQIKFIDARYRFDIVFDIFQNLVDFIEAIFSHLSRGDLACSVEMFNLATPVWSMILLLSELFFFEYLDLVI